MIKFYHVLSLFCSCVRWLTCHVCCLLPHWLCFLLIVTVIVILIHDARLKTERTMQASLSYSCRSPSPVYCQSLSSSVERKTSYPRWHEGKRLPSHQASSAYSIRLLHVTSRLRERGGQQESRGTGSSDNMTTCKLRSTHDNRND